MEGRRKKRQGDVNRAAEHGRDPRSSKDSEVGVGSLGLLH